MKEIRTRIAPSPTGMMHGDLLLGSRPPFRRQIPAAH